MLSRLWFIDDDPINNFICTSLVTACDAQAEVTSFLLVREALDRLSKPIPGPDLIFLDLNMPELDGWDFLDAYQAQAGSAHVVVLTSSPHEEDRLRARCYACVLDYVTKPLSQEYLKQLLLQDSRLLRSSNI